MAARSRGDSDVAESRPRDDAYTGMLVVSLVALIGACVLLYLDYSQYSGKPSIPAPPRIDRAAPAPADLGGGGVPAPAPGVPAPGVPAPAPGVPAPGVPAPAPGAGGVPAPAPGAGTPPAGLPGNQPGGVPNPM